MKTLITVFLLFFSSSVFSKDIFDYEIDGLRVGDTLLTNFSENEIINALNYDHLPSSMKFRIIELEPKSNSIFDSLQFFYKPDDKNYIIHHIFGAIFYKSNVNKCYEKLFIESKKLSNLFSTSSLLGPEKITHPDDNSGKSTITSYYLETQDGLIGVQCYEFSDNVPWTNNFRISIGTRETHNWMENNYF